MSNYTRGPWIVCESQTEYAHGIYDKNYNYVVYYNSIPDINDARLISVAPEMYDFIRDLVDIIKTHGGIVGCESVVLDSAEHLLRKINGDNE